LFLALIVLNLAPMKMNLRNGLNGIGLAALLAWAGPFSAAAEDLTAFQLVKEGNKHVGEDAKDRVVQIRSEKSIAGLQPTIWYVVYYDPDASLKATEVKFGAGKKLSVKRPFRLLEPVTGADKQMPKEKLKIDSDKAIAIALKEPLLERLTIKATQLWLELKDGEPTWKVRLWAAKLSNPNRQVDIGDLYLSAESGKVTENNLKISRVD
jgi:hypothetical protein